jgi:hypothetical protein
MALSASATGSPSPTSPSNASTDASVNASVPRRKQRVSAEHTLTRVRENQRRHRARQRDHVLSLELRLLETERALASAVLEISALKASLQTANALACYDLPSHMSRTHSIQIPTPPVAALVGPPPCCSDTQQTATFTPDVLDVEQRPECETCKTRPPPSPAESTTLCAQAFVLIAQQNVRNLHPEVIRLWLSQGYRRAARAGEGCRVENGTLRGLLEYISEV